MFDEQPDDDPHGECAAEIHRLRQTLLEIVQIVGDEKNYRVWAADLNTCIYTHQPFTTAREILGLPSWVDVLESRGEFV